MDLLKGAGGSPTSAVPGSSLFSATGIPLGKLPLQLLTLFPPTGYLGLNLSAVGMPITAAIKLLRMVLVLLQEFTQIIYM